MVKTVREPRNCRAVKMFGMYLKIERIFYFRRAFSPARQQIHVIVITFGYLAMSESDLPVRPTSVDNGPES